MKSIRSNTDIREQRVAEQLGIRPSELRKRRVGPCERCKRKLCTKRKIRNKRVIWVNPEKADAIISLMCGALCKEYEHEKPEKVSKSS